MAYRIDARINSLPRRMRCCFIGRHFTRRKIAILCVRSVPLAHTPCATPSQSRSGRLALARSFVQTGASRQLVDRDDGRGRIHRRNRP